MSDPRYIVCPACDSVNRVPAERLDAAPNCGRCHMPLLPGEPLELTTARFARHLEHGDLPLLVDFWAPWCGPCRSMAPVYAEAARWLRLRARLAKVNTDAEQELAVRYNIRSIPTLVLFRQGREVARMAGALPLPQLLSWVDPYL